MALRVDENVQKGIPVSGSLYWDDALIYLPRKDIWGGIYVVGALGRKGLFDSQVVKYV